MFSIFSRGLAPGERSLAKPGWFPGLTGLAIAGIVAIAAFMQSVAAVAALSAVLVAAIAAAAVMRENAGERQIMQAAATIRQWAKGRWTSALRDEDAMSPALQSLAAAMTEANEAALQRDQRFCRWTKATGDVLWEWDLASDIVVCLHGGTSVLGAETDAFAQPFAWWQERVHPEDRATVVDSAAALHTTSGAVWSVEYRFQRPDGEYRWFWDRGSTVSDADGRATRIVGCMTDISAQKAAKEQLQLSEMRHRSLVRAISSVVWTVSDTDQNAGGSLLWETYTGQTPEETRGHGWLDAIHPEERERVRANWKHAVATGSIYQEEARLRRHDGVYRWMLGKGAPVYDADGRIREWVGLNQDIHDRYEAEEKLRQKTVELGERVKELRCLHAIAVVCNQERMSIAEILSGVALVLPSALMYPEHGVCRIETSHGLFQSTGYLEPKLCIEAAIEAAGTTLGYITLGYNMSSGDMAFLPEEEQLLDTAAHQIGQMLARRQDRALLHSQANEDALTGLANRRHFQEKLEAAFAAPEAVTAMLLIDLDHFKDVNDTLGHDVGDDLLRTLAARLRAAVGSAGSIARLGGDEFAVLLTELPGGDTAVGVAEGVLGQLRKPVSLNGRETAVRFSAGLAVSPQDGRSAAELMKNADIALYSGKTRGRNAFVTYEAGMRTAIERRVTVCAEVRTGLRDGEFVPFYQPKVRLKTGTIAGFEALLRWRSPDGLKSPAAVMPAFDDRELALGIGKRMLECVIADMVQWRRDGLAFGHVALNTSAADFSCADFAEQVIGRLKAADLQMSSLGIEVTETVLLDGDADSVGPALRRLHAAGIGIALDDFGTGCASLTHLQHYPVDIIKIDRSFIRAIGTDAGSRAITSAVLGLGRSLGMVVTAEGVETADQAELLRASGCDQAQGYFYAKPMPAEAVPDFISGWTRTAAGTKPDEARNAA